MRQIANKDVPLYWRQLTPFRTYSGSLAGYDFAHIPFMPGRLTGADIDRWDADKRRLRYVVVSYSTPIAWVTKDNRVYRVKQKFSATTSRHQGLLRATPLYMIDEYDEAE